MIHLLCPTVRPTVMKETCAQWLGNSENKAGITMTFAVNNESERSYLQGLGNVLVIGNTRRGAPYPVFRLYQAVVGQPEDIVVLVSDDTYSPPSWDRWLRDQFVGRDDAIIVNDGGQFGPCITQPIMTYGCVLKLNRIVNHPSYHHFYADAELFANVSQMGLVRDLRSAPGPIFEHRNWAWGKRSKDEHDEHNVSLWGVDEANMHARMRLPLSERLRVDPDFLKFS